MIITIRFFAGLREALNQSSLSLELAENATVGTVLQRLAELYPNLPLTGLAYAINRQYVTLEATLKPNDELALIPPVSGG
ncbi:MoaD/ThiS family protein [Herpetosiphon giganteus]|uniref:MoaD/ThiS family protein n=1 Tax=Herpetosiphon giganteus TaxID=2029754 RepID=UPI00195E6827|nr:MoaD/ThiS family protein [Herpetosiphon giganteus]MBM7841903.1 molybdopterin converting factor subunit 1 [Herpetosiphon giganteus]